MGMAEAGANGNGRDSSQSGVGKKYAIRSYIGCLTKAEALGRAARQKCFLNSHPNSS
jgi:hypothetical protein